MRLFSRLIAEPPFRLLTKAVLSRWPGVPLETRVRWDLSDRPQYLLGIGTAALQAKAQGIPAITVIEFGVARGDGLRVMEREAELIGRELGIEILVYGFDAGTGLPAATTGDYRDHPDYWQAGDFPMDIPALRASLTDAQLILGDLRDTLPAFCRDPHPPIGFIAFDLDLYSSTAVALSILSDPGVAKLRQVPCYFDDLIPLVSHQWAGELLAIQDFNESSISVKLDQWHAVSHYRPFHEAAYLSRFYVAHDLAAISSTVLARVSRQTVWLGTSLLHFLTADLIELVALMP